MKTLLLTSVLALILALPFSSYAGVSAFGVRLPIERHEVSDRIEGGYVARNLGDTLNVQKLNKKDKSVKNDSPSEKYLVFGVDINSINNS